MDGDIDVDIARWILEFLIRQPLEDRILDSLIATLPLTDENLSIKKSLLIRRIETEIAPGSVSEKILDLLEQIEQLDFRSKIREHSASLEAAYRSVAVACTVKFLDNKGGGDKFEYFHAVKRIWRGKVCKMEKGEQVGLFSEELRSWADEIEAAVWDETICGNLLKKSEGINAVEAVRLYVTEEKENMGPSFLELVAEASRTDDRLKGLLGITAGGKSPSFASADRNAVYNKDVHGEVQGRNGLPRLKYAASKRPRVAVSGMSRGAKITNTESSGTQMYNLPSTPEVNQVQEALKSSSLELKAVVKDPLPDALHVAETVVSGLASKDTTKLPVDQSHSRTNPSVESLRPGQADAGDRANHSREHQNDAPKQSLMAQNSTAHTVEWEDSIEETSEDYRNHRNRAHLSTPKSRVVSPLRKYEANNLKKRRQIKRWSLLEEDTLRTGVETYGRGNWKVILNAYRDVFEERTEVDLKDKWRNMTR